MGHRRRQSYSAELESVYEASSLRLTVDRPGTPMGSMLSKRSDKMLTKPRFSDTCLEEFPKNRPYECDVVAVFGPFVPCSWCSKDPSVESVVAKSPVRNILSSPWARVPLSGLPKLFRHY